MFAAGCVPDFGLDDRVFCLEAGRCDAAPPDAPPPDAVVADVVVADVVVADSGPDAFICSLCADTNECTDDICPDGGGCDHPANSAGCGTGCQCVEKEKHESFCEDGADNDGDGQRDCRDTDSCAGCTGLQSCCTDGVCRSVCL